MSEPELITNENESELNEYGRIQSDVLIERGGVINGIVKQYECDNCGHLFMCSPEPDYCGNCGVEFNTVTEEV